MHRFLRQSTTSSPRIHDHRVDVAKCNFLDYFVESESESEWPTQQLFMGSSCEPASRRLSISQVYSSQRSIAKTK